MWNQYMHLDAVTQLGGCPLSLDWAEVRGFGCEMVLPLEIGQMPYEHFLSPETRTK